jgi:hypothetical protein
MLRKSMIVLVSAAAIAVTVGSGVSKAAVMTPVPRMAADSNIIPAYYYHRHYYPYRWHGHYYRYHWHGHYYRYHRHGHYY